VKNRLRISLLAAVVVTGLGRPVVFGQTDPVVRNLRLAADASGTALAEVEAGPGEKRYHLDVGVRELHMAFDCTGVPGDVQLRLIQPPGTPLDLQDRTCSDASTQVVTYTQSEPLADNEYVVNLYVGTTEPFLADSVQFTVGAAEIPPDEGAQPPPAPQTTVAPNPPAGVPADRVVENAAAEVDGAPSKLLLVLAGAGILALLAVVVWAGWSAMTK
jgi:hypothetical protein